MSWSINLHQEVHDWYMQLLPEEVGHIEGVIDLLEVHGPGLGQSSPEHEGVEDWEYENSFCVRPEARGDPSCRRGQARRLESLV